MMNRLFKAQRALFKPITFIIAGLFLISCDIDNPRPDDIEQVHALENPSITLNTITQEGSELLVEVATTIPLPIEVMVSAALRHEDEEELSISSSTRLVLDENPQELRLPLHSHGLDPRPFPNGAYLIEVGFYPRWGAEHSPPETRAIQERIYDEQEVILTGLEEDGEQAVARVRGQAWAMENTFVGSEWDRQQFEDHLGPAEQMPTQGGSQVLADFYFPDSNVSVIVNTSRNTVATWHIGEPGEE